MLQSHGILSAVEPPGWADNESDLISTAAVGYVLYMVRRVSKTPVHFFMCLADIVKNRWPPYFATSRTATKTNITQLFRLISCHHRAADFCTNFGCRKYYLIRRIDVSMHYHCILNIPVHLRAPRTETANKRHLVCIVCTVPLELHTTVPNIFREYSGKFPVTISVRAAPDIFRGSSLDYSTENQCITITIIFFFHQGKSITR